MDCLKLKMGQFRCTETIDPATQQLRECTKDNIAKGKRAYHFISKLLYKDN